MQADPQLSKNKLAAEGMQDMKLLFGYLDAYGILSKVRTVFPCVL